MFTARVARTCCFLRSVHGRLELDAGVVGCQSAAAEHTGDVFRHTLGDRQREVLARHRHVRLEAETAASERVLTSAACRPTAFTGHFTFCTCMFFQCAVVHTSCHDILLQEV